MTDPQREIEEQGFAVLPGFFSVERVASLVCELDHARLELNGSVLQSRGHVYGIRNLSDVWPGAQAVVQDARLPSDRQLAAMAQPIHMRAGDVLLMRPLLLHRSGRSRPDTIRRHRRTLYFEFAAEKALPNGLQWYRFLGTAP